MAGDASLRGRAPEGCARRAAAALRAPVALALGAGPAAATLGVAAPGPAGGGAAVTQAGTLLAAATGVSHSTRRRDLKLL
jgi:hypothetical protein